jgi:predicted metal-binding protein
MEEIKYNRTDAILMQVKKVSEFLNEINIKADDHNKLIEMLTNMLNITERELFLQGLEYGVLLAQGNDKGVTWN